MVSASARTAFPPAAVVIVTALVRDVGMQQKRASPFLNSSGCTGRYWSATPTNGVSNNTMVKPYSSAALELSALPTSCRRRQRPLMKKIPQVATFESPIEAASFPGAGHTAPKTIAAIKPSGTKLSDTNLRATDFPLLGADSDAPDA
eukprot:scaffold102_cov340-Pavlova_lutheri.AAC.12